MSTTFWYEKSGNINDVVVSSRIRLARNIRGIPFTSKLNKIGAEEVISRVKNVVDIIDRRFSFFNSKDLNKLQKLSLLEGHIISPDFIKSTLPTALAVSDDESFSVMVNEEDHVRLQVFSSGFNLEETYNTADNIDNFFNEQLGFSFSEEFGYLTQCPTNLGIGMRASLMLHLPALKMNGIMSKLPDSLFKLGLTIRGTYGEGTNSLGDMYQISNQITLGITEKAAIKNLENVSMQLISQEKKSRDSLKNNIKVLDKIHRSFGILSNCRLLSAEDLLELSSNIRLGIAVGEIKNITFNTVNLLIFNAQNANTQLKYDKDLTVTEQNALRAEFVRKVLADC